MEKLTRWQKSMQDVGYQIIDFSHEEIMDHLISVFKRDEDHLLSMAASDNTKRHELCFVLDYENIGKKETIFGGCVFYNKKLRRFTHISYSDNRNWAIQFSIESKVAFFAYYFWKDWRKIFPFGASIKKLKEYLLTH